MHCRALYELPDYEGAVSNGAKDDGPLEPGEYVLQQNVGADGAAKARSQTFRLTSVPTSSTEEQVAPHLPVPDSTTCLALQALHCLELGRQA